LPCWGGHGAEPSAEEEERKREMESIPLDGKGKGGTGYEPNHQSRMVNLNRTGWEKKNEVNRKGGRNDREENEGLTVVNSGLSKQRMEERKGAPRKPDGEKGTSPRKTRTVPPDQPNLRTVQNLTITWRLGHLQNDQGSTCRW